MPIISGSFTQFHYRFYNDDGSESTNTAQAAEDTAVSLNAYSNVNTVLRISLQETGTGGSATDDFQLQVSKNGGGYANVTTSSTNTLGFNSANLTDGGATTARLTAGTGGFTAGEVSEDGLVDDLNVTTSTYTELLYTLTVVSADVAHGDYLDFRVLYNAGTITYNVTPRINVTKSAPAVITTNLLIGKCTIPLASTSFSFSADENSTYPLLNLIGGSRFDIFKRRIPGSGDHLITIDLGASTTLTANYIYIAKANLLQNDDVGTITVKGHSANNYAAATTVTTISSFGSATLRGPHSEDYVSIFTESAAYRYWFVNYNTSSSNSEIPHSKLFLGKLFDPGVDPTPDVEVTRVRTAGGRRKALYTFKLKWEGLTYTKTNEMVTTFATKRRYDLIVLVTQSYHDILHGHRVILGRITSFTSPPRVTDYNSVTMTVEEAY